MTTVHLPLQEQRRAMRLAMVDGVLYALPRDAEEASPGERPIPPRG